MENGMGLGCGIFNHMFKERPHLRSHFTRVHPVQLVQCALPLATLPKNRLNTANVNFHANRNTSSDINVNNDSVHFCQNFFNNEVITFDIFRFYDRFGDKAFLLFNLPPALSTALSCLPAAVLMCIRHVCNNSLTIADNDEFHELSRSRCTAVQTSSELRLDAHFKTQNKYLYYFRSYRKVMVIENGWLRSSIHIDRCDLNKTGVFRWPILRLFSILSQNDDPSSIIPFKKIFDLNGFRCYSSPWDSKLYDSYVNNVGSDNIVPIYYYSDGTT